MRYTVKLPTELFHTVLDSLKLAYITYQLNVSYYTHDT